MYFCLQDQSHRTVLHFKRTTNKAAAQTTTRKSPLICPVILPGSPTLNPSQLGFPPTCPINPKVPLLTFHPTSRLLPSTLTSTNSSTSPPCSLIIPSGPGRINQAGLPFSPTTPGPGRQVLLGSPQPLRLCGLSCTWMNLHTRGWWRLRQEEHQERRVVKAGAVTAPRTWTLIRVGKGNKH